MFWNYSSFLVVVSNVDWVVFVFVSQSGKKEEIMRFMPDLRRQLQDSEVSFGVGIGNSRPFEETGWLAKMTGKEEECLGYLKFKLRQHLLSKECGSGPRNIVVFFEDGVFGGRLRLTASVRFHCLVVRKGIVSSDVRIMDESGGVVNVADYSHVGRHLETICAEKFRVEFHHVSVRGEAFLELLNLLWD